jgi:hypothetical protein
MRNENKVRNRLVAAAVALTSTMAVTSTSRATPPLGDAIDAPRAAPDRAMCIAAHHDAQELRKAGKLLDAGKKLLVCASETCPGPIVTDCVTWTGQLEEATPSLVLEIEADGRAPTEAKVSVDNVAMKDWSHAIVVDPGAHVVKVEVPSFPPYVEKVVMAEGHRRRLLSVKLETPRRSAAPPRSDGSAESAPAPEPRRPVPVLTYPLLAMGVAGLAGFAVFAPLGKAQQNNLEHGCAETPRGCSESQLGPMKTDYLIGDLALSVGAASLITAAIVYLTRPAEGSQPVLSVGIGGSSSSFQASTTVHF